MVSTAGSAFVRVSDGGVEVTLSTIDAELSCDGAVLLRAFAIPCSVRWVRVSVASTGGVIAIGAIAEVVWERIS